MARLGRDRARVEVLREGDNLYVSWRVFDRGDFDFVRESFKAQFPLRSSGAEWWAAEKCWRLPLYQRAVLRAWLARTFEREAITWPLAEADAQQERQDVPRRPQASPLVEAYATLYLLPTAPPEVVQAAQRALVKIHHPDAGGTHEAAVALNTAVDLIHQHQTRSGAA